VRRPLLWSADAEADLDDIADYIARDDVLAAVQMREEIEHRLEILTSHPEGWRRGRLPGSREMVLAGTPFIGIYRVDDSQVTILRVLHGARRWPP
jgi:toxin ParE1/3/4